MLTFADLDDRTLSASGVNGPRFGGILQCVPVQQHNDNEYNISSLCILGMYRIPVLPDSGTFKNPVPDPVPTKFCQICAGFHLW
jgi:hypothetical protein